MVSQKLMAVNPELAMKLGSQAELMDNREAQEELRKTNKEMKETGQFASLLASVDATTYQPLMLERMAQGKEIPKWYTGNYETDKPFIQAAANAALTRQQQVEADNKATRAEIYNMKTEGAIAKAQAQAIQAQAELERKRQKDENLRIWREQEQKQKDKDLALKQQKLEKKQSLVPSKTELGMALDTVLEHPELKGLDSASQNAAATEIAAKAKKSLTDDDTIDYADALSEAASEVAKRVKPSSIPFFGKSSLNPRTSQEADGKITPKGEVNTYSPQQEDWISRAMKANPGMSRDQIVAAGKQKGKL